MSPTTEQPITIRIVFDGAPLAGKTTVTHSLAAALGDTPASPSQEGGLIASFDWGAYTDGAHRGEAVDVEIVSVPPEPNAQDRRLELLEWGDVVVFVADSTESGIDVSFARLQELRNDLEGVGQKPVIVVANKRDLGTAIALPQLQSQLNLADGDVVVESIATAGVGAIDATMLSVHAALTADGHRFESESTDPLLRALDAAINKTAPGSGELPLSGASTLAFSHWDDQPDQDADTDAAASSGSQWQQISAIEESAAEESAAGEDADEIADEIVESEESELADEIGDETSVEDTSELESLAELDEAQASETLPERSSFFGGPVPSPAAESIADSEPATEEPEEANEPKSFFGSGTSTEDPAPRKSFFGNGVAESSSDVPTPPPVFESADSGETKIVDSDGWVTYVPADEAATQDADQDGADQDEPTVEETADPLTELDTSEPNSFFGGPAPAPSTPVESEELSDETEELADADDFAATEELLETDDFVGADDFVETEELLDSSDEVDEVVEVPEFDVASAPPPPIMSTGFDQDLGDASDDFVGADDFVETEELLDSSDEVDEVVESEVDEVPEFDVASAPPPPIMATELSEQDVQSEPEEPESPPTSGFPFHAAPPLVAEDSDADEDSVEDDRVDESVSEAELQPVAESSLPLRTEASTPVAEDAPEESASGEETVEKNSRYRALKALRQTLR